MIQTFNNKTEKVGDDFKNNISKGSKLDVAAGIFTIYGFESLKKELKKILINEERLMNRLSIKERSMPYVYSCFMSVNRKCIDFLKDWESFCSDSYLLENRSIYYPFQDETSFNVLLWKRNCTQNYGRIFLNTLYSDPLEFVEDKVNDGFEGRVYSVPEQFVDNSSDIMFYHGLKNEVELKNSLNYLRKQSESKGGGAINE